MPHTLVDTRITLADGKEHHLVVSSPTGGGGSYQVLIDNYYRGSLHKYSTGWQANLNTNLLYSDDIGALLDMVSG